MRFFQKIYQILTIDCEQVSRLESLSFEQKLPWHERWAARLHRIGCRSCRQFLHHLRMLRESFDNLSRADDESPEPQPMQLSADAKERIRGRLREDS